MGPSSLLVDPLLLCRSSSNTSSSSMREHLATKVVPSINPKLIVSSSPRNKYLSETYVTKQILPIRFSHSPDAVTMSCCVLSFELLSRGPRLSYDADLTQALEVF